MRPLLKKGLLLGALGLGLYVKGCSDGIDRGFLRAQRDHYRRLEDRIDTLKAASLQEVENQISHIFDSISLKDSRYSLHPADECNLVASILVYLEKCNEQQEAQKQQTR